MSDVIIIGAGAVGANAALFLAHLGMEVDLLDDTASILSGAPRASFINHGDGFEYYKLGHQRTGQYCIDGSLTKGLLYPLGTFGTRVVDAQNPIRFLVSAGSVSKGELTLARFRQNAESMREHFTRQFNAVRAARGWTEEEASARFLRRPDTFMRQLQLHEYADVSSDHVVGGCAGSSFGINMPHYYAFLKSALDGAGVRFYGNETPVGIGRTGRSYFVQTDTGTFRAPVVLLTAGHKIPILTTMIGGSLTSPPAAGTYYLNVMTFVRIPSSVDLAAARRINFTLQQEHGGMFACIVPPTEDEEGMAAIYFPHTTGSQLRQHVFDPSHPAPPPKEWDDIAANGVAPDDPQVRNVLAKTAEIYPVLRDATISHSICRTVFNIATPDSDGGRDRRVRELASMATRVTADGRVSAWAAPKWTNAELVALAAVDEALTLLRADKLPQTGSTSFGPWNLDVAAIADIFDFSAVRIEVADAEWYASEQGVPLRIVERRDRPDRAEA